MLVLVSDRWQIWLAAAACDHHRSWARHYFGCGLHWSEWEMPCFFCSSWFSVNPVFPKHYCNYFMNTITGVMRSLGIFLWYCLVKQCHKLWRNVIEMQKAGLNLLLTDLTWYYNWAIKMSFKFISGKWLPLPNQSLKTSADTSHYALKKKWVHFHAKHTLIKIILKIKYLHVQQLWEKSCLLIRIFWISLRCTL